MSSFEAIVMITEIIEKRRAVFPRQYNTDSISKEEIQKVLEAANWAPTHKHTEPWRFKVIYGTERLEQFSKFLGERYKATAKRFSQGKYERTMEKVKRSGCIILICFQSDPKNRLPEWEEVAATAMAVQNMWLTAAELEIGAYWSTSGLRQDIGQFVELNEGERCLGFFYMGKYDGELPEGKREPIEDKVEWI